MELNRSTLKEAVENGLVSDEQAERLWEFFQARGMNAPAFRFTHILYYLGGLIAIGAMSLFMNLGWEQFGGWGLFSIALAYAAAGLWLTGFFLKRLRLPIPAGITAAFVVVLTPLAVYGLQLALGWWAEGRVYRDYHAYIDWRWMFMELATLAAGAAMLWRYPLPFLVMPLAATLWYMSMDLTPFLFGAADSTWEIRRLVSLWFGLLIALAVVFWERFSAIAFALLGRSASSLDFSAFSAASPAAICFCWATSSARRETSAVLSRGAVASGVADSSPRNGAG